ncbi:MAG TPA: hypothetical protein VKV28_12675 [Candidatus Binataceae bacterium]|nr:hypothetical protein [Candidatus Binataceae bacterium]
MEDCFGLVGCSNEAIRIYTPLMRLLRPSQHALMGALVLSWLLEQSAQGQREWTPAPDALAQRLGMPFRDWLTALQLLKGRGYVGERFAKDPLCNTRELKLDPVRLSDDLNGKASEHRFLYALAP